MMINIIASSSNGNAYHIVEGKKNILIEAGLKYDLLKMGLNFKAAQLDACLISHEHKDHCKSVHKIMRLGVPVLMSEGTSSALGINGTIKLSSESQASIAGWKIMPFAVEHDAAEPLGFLIESPLGAKLCYATDTCYLRYRFEGINYYMIECNYDKDMLEDNEDIDFRTKARITRTHFELTNVGDFFAAQDLSSCIEIYLLHLSKQNSDVNRFVDKIKAITGKPVFAR